jgi:hygromycin-B 4-O-kinase
VSSEQAEAFLRRRFGAGVDAVPVARQGEWSRAYAFRHDARDYIIRFSALGEDFRKDVLATRFASPALPIPAIIEIGETDDGFYAISERVPGSFLDELDPSGMRTLLPSLFAALDAMREAHLAGTTGYGIWGADGDAPHASWRAALLDVAYDRPGDRIHGWRDRLVAAPTGSQPFEQAYGRLGELIGSCPEERHLIHSDLLNFNVLVAGERISGVIDWGCAMWGDWLYDLAWLTFWAPWYPAWRGIDFAAEATRHYAAIGLDVPNFAQRMACFQIHIGLGAQAYNAFKDRWAALAETAARTLELATSAPAPD